MTTYTEKGENLAAQDFVMYGSSRLGIKNADPLLATAVNTKLLIYFCLDTKVTKSQA